MGGARHAGSRARLALLCTATRAVGLLLLAGLQGGPVTRGAASAVEAPEPAQTRGGGGGIREAPVQMPHEGGMMMAGGTSANHE